MSCTVYILPISRTLLPWQDVYAGHSLGGALAYLAAFDLAKIQKELAPSRENKTVCYTFGAPRIGNFVFKAEFEASVLNFWIHTFTG